MKTSLKKFVIVFLLSAFAFQFITNSLLGDKIGLFPKNGNWYAGFGSSIAWKNTVATIIYPVKYVLVEPLSFLAQDPDPVPPVLILAFAIYWTLFALILYFLSSLIFKRKQTKA